VTHDDAMLDRIDSAVRASGELAVGLIAGTEGATFEVWPCVRTDRVSSPRSSLSGREATLTAWIVLDRFVVAFAGEEGFNPTGSFKDRGMAITPVPARLDAVLAQLGR
jgi:hypothetical protein